MSLSRDSKDERIAKFLLRQQFKTKQGIERILWEEGTLIPAINAMKSGLAVPELNLPAGAAFEVVVEDARQTSDQTPDSE